MSLSKTLCPGSIKEGRKHPTMTEKLLWHVKHQHKQKLLVPVRFVPILTTPICHITNVHTVYTLNTGTKLARANGINPDQTTPIPSSFILAHWIRISEI